MSLASITGRIIPRGEQKGTPVFAPAGPRRATSHFSGTMRRRLASVEEVRDGNTADSHYWAPGPSESGRKTSIEGVTAILRTRHHRSFLLKWATCSNSVTLSTCKIYAEDPFPFVPLPVLTHGATWFAASILAPIALAVIHLKNNSKFFMPARLVEPADGERGQLEVVRERNAESGHCSGIVIMNAAERIRVRACIEDAPGLNNTGF